jgi:NAD(P) transhydrogenase subunit alpha
MKIAVPTEIQPGERRVAMVPDVAKKLVTSGFDVCIQSGAGTSAGYPDSAFKDAGCSIADGAEACWKDADVVFKINKLQEHDGQDEIDLVPEKCVYISLLAPMFEPERMAKLAERGCTAFSMDAIPRTSRAQSMDALSSQGNIAGYKAVLEAANRMPKLMPMLMTAAGTIAPAKVFILGAGVAGLQAIATARRLGAVVSAFDVRPVVEEQVKSLGAKFVQIDIGESGAGEGGYAKELSEEGKAKQRAALGKIATGMDVIITTAAIPGRQAPRLIEADAVRAMKPGSVIVDLAAATGGNVEGSKPDEVVDVEGTTILGPTNLVAEMPKDASMMYAKNITALFDLMLKEGEDKKKTLEIDWEDDILAAAVITRDGAVVHERTKALLDKKAA